jgi:hypothetical protein
MSGDAASAFGSCGHAVAWALAVMGHVTGREQQQQTPWPIAAIAQFRVIPRLSEHIANWYSLRL